MLIVGLLHDDNELFIFLAIEVSMNQFGMLLTQMMMWTQSGDLTLQATR
jgi:hypothetical protein